MWILVPKSQMSRLRGMRMHLGHGLRLQTSAVCWSLHLAAISLTFSLRCPAPDSLDDNNPDLCAIVDHVGVDLSEQSFTLSALLCRSDKNVALTDMFMSLPWRQRRAPASGLLLISEGGMVGRPDTAPSTALAQRAG